MRMLLSLFTIASLSILVQAAPITKENLKPLPPITKEMWATSQENLKQMALGFHNYESAYLTFPTNLISKTKKPLLSWRVQILPYMEYDELFKEFKLDEPWDSEHNKKLIPKMPKIYAPVRGHAKEGETFYQSTTGKNGLIKSGQKLNIATIADGTTNTFLVVEADKPVIWTKPDDLEFNGEQLPKFGGMFDGHFNAAMCDGSVKTIRQNANADQLKFAIQPNDGHLLDFDQLIKKD